MIRKFRNFIKSSYQELKKVTWPTKREAARLTAYVIGVSLCVGLFVAGIDYLLNTLLEQIVS